MTDREGLVKSDSKGTNPPVPLYDRRFLDAQLQPDAQQQLVLKTPMLDLKDFLWRNRKALGLTVGAIFLLKRKSWIDYMPLTNIHYGSDNDLMTIIDLKKLLIEPVLIYGGFYWYSRTLEYTHSVKPVTGKLIRDVGLGLAFVYFFRQECGKYVSHVWQYKGRNDIYSRSYGPSSSYSKVNATDFTFVKTLTYDRCISSIKKPISLAYSVYMSTYLHHLPKEMEEIEEGKLMDKIQQNKDFIRNGVTLSLGALIIYCVYKYW